MTILKFENYKPMLANHVSFNGTSKYGSYIMEVKLDGVRCIAIKKGNEVHLWSRSGKGLTDKLPHLVAQLSKVRGDFVLDGEIGYVLQDAAHAPDVIRYGIDFNATMRVLGSNPPTARLKQATNDELGIQPIKYVVFDILYWAPENDLTNKKQKDRSAALAEWYMLNTGIDDQPDVLVSRIWSRFDKEFYIKIVSLGGEGVMLKNPDAEYHPGVRKANTWYKVKGHDIIDCIIVGFDLGTGKYESQIGALIVKDPQGREIRVSGMTDAQRRAMTRNFQDYKNCMCEVRYFGRVGRDQQGYRHPQFLRMRRDLDPTPSETQQS